MLGQKGGSRTDTLIKLVLIFFISLLSFSVGTFVGKQFSDSQHKLSQLENEYESGSRETASVPANALDVKPDEALTEKDIQKIADEFTKPEAVGEESHATPEKVEDVHAAVNSEGHEEAAAPAHEAAHEAPIAEAHREVASAHVEKEPAKKVDTHTLTKVADRVAEGKSPTEPRAEVKNNMPKELPEGIAASTVGKFTVQISSHQNENEAKDEASKLKAKGFSAFVITANVKGKQWYRVSVGLFDKKEEAKSYREKLLKEAGVSSAFVQQIIDDRLPATSH